MEELKSLLNRTETDGEVNKEAVFSDWTHFTHFDVLGSALQFTEARVIGCRGNDAQECFEIPVENGRFQIECKVANYHTEARIAAMRAYPVGVDGSTLTVGREIKQLSVDFGGIAVVDIGTVHQSMNADQKGLLKWLDKFVYRYAAVAADFHTWQPTSTIIPRVESGFGGGCYPLYPLSLSNRQIGLLVVFIEDGEQHPLYRQQVARGI